MTQGKIFKLNLNILYLQQIENVRMLDRYNNRKPSTGTLYLTATHLIFVDPDDKKETWVSITSLRISRWSGSYFRRMQLT